MVMFCMYRLFLSKLFFFFNQNFFSIFYVVVVAHICLPSCIYKQEFDSNKTNMTVNFNFALKFFLRVSVHMYVGLHLMFIMYLCI